MTPLECIVVHSWHQHQRGADADIIFCPGLLTVANHPAQWHSLKTSPLLAAHPSRWRCSHYRVSLLSLQKEDATDGGDEGQMPKTVAAAADAPSRGTRAASRSRASSAAAEVCVQATYAGLAHWLHTLALPWHCQRCHRVACRPLHFCLI